MTTASHDMTTASHVMTTVSRSQQATEIPFQKYYFKMPPQLPSYSQGNQHVLLQTVLKNAYHDYR
jgi:hypothetical protein